MTALQIDAQLAERDLDVQLTVPAGHTLALLGPNGAGKSTILGAVAGLVALDSGRIAHGDVVLFEQRPGGVRRCVSPHRRQVGLVAQEALVFPHLSALQNVAFGPRAQGQGRKSAARLAADWLARVGLADMAHRPGAALSGGEAQRVAVARALAADPSAVLLDEPLGAVDVGSAPAMRALLREVLGGRTVIVTTHDVLDALLLADRVAIVEGGRVVEEGATAEVLARPRSGYGAKVAGLNLLGGVWDGEVLRLPDDAAVRGRSTQPMPVGTAAIAVFRPASVAVFRGHDPGGSPRNAYAETITAVEPHADIIRVRTHRLSADVTPSAALDLGLAPGLSVTMTVKATEVEIYPA